MTRRDWWLGVSLLVAAIMLHALVPRYEWQHIEGAVFMRVDRWTGRAMMGSFVGGHWTIRALQENGTP
jgi:hypothetical protein